MPWDKNQSGNPAGRPPKNRALTEILEKTGSRTIVDHDGVKRSGKRILARLVWDIAKTGKATFPDGSELSASPGDWFGIVKWIYQHIDGPPPQKIEHSGQDDSPIEITVRYIEQPPTTD